MMMKAAILFTSSGRSGSADPVSLVGVTTLGRRGCRSLSGRCPGGGVADSGQLAVALVALVAVQGAVPLSGKPLSRHPQRAVRQGMCAGFSEATQCEGEPEIRTVGLVARGMDCRRCAREVTARLRNLPGVDGDGRCRQFRGPDDAPADS